MEEQAKHLLDLTWLKLLETPADQRLLIAIAGPPGSGKTTLAQLLTSTLNARSDLSSPSSSSSPFATFVPMDGYHYSRAQLDLFPDPQEAHRRRGSEFTFDGQSFIELVKRVSKAYGKEDVYAPSFDHARKDPLEGEIKIEKDVRVVVFEGNYILLPNAPWSQVLPLYSLKFFINAPTSVLRARLAARHVRAGLVPTLELGQDRADFNDIPNGIQIQEGILAHPPRTIDMILESKDDQDWASK
ncbi:ATP-dependent kinase [Cladorrhinum sp. PSN259]|nr:ATP-dependent kinase [Cladorrhinum sp. PSN259]